MKKYFVSTFVAIALALPLGVGGLTVTAPVTATDADAQSVTAADHHFQTCSNLVIWRCRSGHRTFIFENYFRFGYKAGDRYLPFGSDGVDFKAYDYLKLGIDTGRDRTGRVFADDEDSAVFNGRAGGVPVDEHGMSERQWWQAAFDRFFPDGVRPPQPPYINAHQELNRIHREQQGFQIGDTPEERQENFERMCEQNSGIVTTRFRFGPEDFAAIQCRFDNVVTEDPDDPNAESTIESIFASFNPNPHPDDDPLGQFTRSTPNFLFQVTSLDDFGTGNENPFTDGEERQVISDHRDRIIELQEEVTMHDEYIATMLQLQNSNSDNIRSNTASIRALNSRVDTFADDIRKNKAGIALAYAFPSSGLNYNESFRLSGGAGYFREETSVAFGFTGRLSTNVTASGGVGLADGVSGARVEIGYGW